MTFTDQYNSFSSIIEAGGSLSGVFDTEGWEIAGLVIAPTSGTLSAGNVQFRVGYNASTLYPLVDENGTRVGLTHGTTAAAFKASVVVQAIAAYRYFRVETSVAQGNGAAINIPVKL